MKGTEAVIYKRKHENKKNRKKDKKQELDQESDEEKRKVLFFVDEFLFCFITFFCFLTFFFSFINSHLRTEKWRDRSIKLEINIDKEITRQDKECQRDRDSTTGISTGQN